MKKKLLASLLALVLVLGMLPMAVWADFSDTDGHWGKDAIDRWASEGVLNGKGDGVFDPNGSMTRAEFAQMLCNLMGYTKKAANSFVDVPDDAWYADAILKLVEAGVLNGVGNNMAAPNAPITREQAAVMLCRAFNIKTGSGSLSYADAGDVSSWATGAVSALTEMGMLNGVGDNQVAPQMNINRASVAKLIDNMVVEYVTESKTITGEVNGIVVVAADVTVTFEDATVNAPVIVAPAAAGADVALTGTTTAENVVVAAEKASVTVGKDASAESVTAAADKAEVKVEGTVDTVAVEGEGAKVDVSGTVGTVSTEAANTTVAVSGTVENVEIAEGADKTNVTTTSTAKIDNVTTAAEDVKVSGTGEVGTVTATDGSVDVTVKDAVVKNEGADKATAGDKEVAKGEEETVKPTTGGGGGSSSGGGSQTNTNAAGVAAAPLADHPADETKAIDNTNDQLGKVTVTSTAVSGQTNEYDVVIKGEKIMKHANANHVDGYWVGFGMEIQTGEGAPTYTYKIDGDSSKSSDIAGRTCVVGGKTYNTVYFKDATEESFNSGSVVVKQIATPTSGDAVETTYNVTFNVTFYKPTAKVSTVVDADLAEDGSEDWVKPAILTLNAPSAAANEISVTVPAITDIAKLITWTGKNDTAAQYSYYCLSWDDENIAKITFTSADGATNPAPVTQFLKTEKAVNAFKVIQNNATKKVTHTFTAVDAAGREQGTFTVTLDSTAATLPEGTVSVTFKDGDTVVSTVIAADNKVTAPALPANTANKYYTGWVKTGDTTVTAAGGEISGITAATTCEAKSITITSQDATGRPDGPDGPENSTWPALYTKAGMGISGTNGIYTIETDAAELIKLTTAEKGILTNSGNIYYGVQFAKPQDATKMVYSASPDFTSPSKEFDVSAADKNSKDNAGDVLNGEYVDYFSVAAVDAQGALTFAAKSDVTRYFKWMKADGEIVGVTKATIKRTISNQNNLKVNVTVEGIENAKYEATYNTAIGEDGLAAIEKLGGENNVLLNIKNNGTDVTADTKFTADTVLSADVVPVVAVTLSKGNETAAESAGATIAINGTAATISVDRAKLAAFENVADTSLFHGSPDRLYACIGFTVPTINNKEISKFDIVISDGSLTDGEDYKREVAGLSKANLNAKDTDLDLLAGDDEKATVIGDWFGFATVASGKASPRTDMDGKDPWTVTISWKDSSGKDIGISTFTVALEYTGTAPAAGGGDSPST